MPAISATVLKKVRAAYESPDRCEFGWRTLATRLAQILRLPNVPGHETVRRMRGEIRFDGLEALKARIAQDVREVAALLS
jgi:hypothetical protein